MISRTIATAARAVTLLAALSATAAGLDYRIEWDTNRSSVRVDGPIASDLLQAESARLQKVFPVTVEPQNVLAAIGLPPMAGTYFAHPTYLQFDARFPFEPGVRYRATFQKSTSVLALPKPVLTPTTIVTQVYPTASTLPQNLLKFYLQFSAPMSRGHIYDHIHLLDESGKPVELPFLEIDEELWTPDMTRLTLFLDPGRIKRGVRPLEEVGPALLPGKRYTLQIAAEWHDARGVPLKQPFEKSFRVTDPDREAPDPAQWQITVPSANSRQPVLITFTDPMDHALALRMINIEGLTGQSSLDSNETIWRFVPDQPWKSGPHKINILTTIEDLAGNNIGKPFEVDLEQPRAPLTSLKAVTLRFNVD